MARWKLLFPILVTILTACTPFAPAPRDLEAFDMPTEFSLYSQTESENTRWWNEFNSEQLNLLIDQALQDNLTLREARARLAQAEASGIKSGAGRFPDLTLSADAGRTKQSDERSNGQDPSQGSLGLGLASSYELDLWGRVQSNLNASRLESSASREDLQTAAISLTAELSDRWLQLQAQQQLLHLLQQQIETNRTYLELIELRFTKSLATALDVYQQQEAIARLEAGLPPIEAETQRLRHEINLLLGKPAGTDLQLSTAPLPDLGPLPPLGIPAETLAQRPDVRAAGLRLQAADWQISAARADRLPAIRLIANANLSSTDSADLFDNWLLNLAGSLTGPIFDGRSRAAEVERTKALAEERLATYQKNVLTAVKEVEDALISETKKAQEIAALRRQLQLAGKGLEQARQRYQKGLNDYLPVLAQLQSVQQLEQELIRQNLALLQYRIALHRALGGGFDESESQSVSEHGV